MSGNTAFSEMSFLKMAAGETDRTGTSRSATELAQVYAQHLASIIGNYAYTSVLFANLAVAADKALYEGIINDPEVSIVREEGQFTVDEEKSADTYYKNTGYHVMLVYRKNDFGLACRKMTEYIECQKNMVPKITHTGGLEETKRAWEMFTAGIPGGPTPECVKVTAMLAEFIEEVRNGEELANKDTSEYNSDDEKPAAGKAGQLFPIPELGDVIVRNEGDEEDEEEV